MEHNCTKGNCGNSGGKQWCVNQGERFRKEDSDIYQLGIWKAEKENKFWEKKNAT